MSYEKLTAPSTGTKITISEDKSLNVPNNPIIPFIEGDGIGPDIWAASQPVFDAAVEKAYSGERKITWFEIFAGEKAVAEYGDITNGSPKTLSRPSPTTSLPSKAH